MNDQAVENYRQLLNQAYGNYNIVHYYTIIASPYGTPTEVYHNQDTNKYVEIWPASGSHMEFIDEDRAKKLIEYAIPEKTERQEKRI